MTSSAVDAAQPHSVPRLHEREATDRRIATCFRDGPRVIGAQQPKNNVAGSQNRVGGLHSRLHWWAAGTSALDEGLAQELRLAPVLFFFFFAFGTPDPMWWLAPVRVRISIRLGIVAQTERRASLCQLAPEFAFNVFPQDGLTLHQHVMVGGNSAPA